MALKFQFNKISLLHLRKQLKIREGALPTLKSKESALRLTIKKRKHALKEIVERYSKQKASLEKIGRMWAEFPDDLFAVNNINLSVKKIAGIQTPVLESIDYDVREFSRFIRPAWLSSGVILLKETSELLIEIKIAEKSIEILEYARKKTTQKVNLYEKVQIPAYSEALLKIKRYLEDVENLEKAAQKITKQRQSAAEGAA